MTYYHLTTKENIPEITKHGLLPVRGRRSEQIGEERNGIFLCGKKDIPYWNIILGLDHVVQIKDLEPIEKTDETYFEYDGYAEYIYTEPIPPEKLSIHKIRKQDKKVNKELAESYLWTLSAFTVFCAEVYNGAEKDKELIQYQGNALMMVLPSLDYDVFETEELGDIIYEIGDGNCAFTDEYLNTGRTLWEQLIEYPKDETSKIREEIHDYVHTVLKERIKGLYTGGWTN